MNNKEPGYVYILTNPSFREDWSSHPNMHIVPDTMCFLQLIATTRRQKSLPPGY